MGGTVAQLGVFLHDDCNPTKLASEVIALDSKAQHGHAASSSHELFPASSSSSAAAAASTHSSSNGHHNNSHKTTSRSEEFLQQINDMVTEIDGAITQHITNNHMSLLSHVGSVDGLQKHANHLHGNVAKLQTCIDDMELSLAKQRDHLQQLIQKHRRVEQTSELIRRLVRFHQLSEKVEQVMQTFGFASSSNASTSSKLQSLPSELNSVALAIREIDALATDPRFEQLSPVQKRLPAIRRFALTIRREMRARLKTEVENLNQTQMASCLQVLFYLDCLAESVETLVNDVIQTIELRATSSIAEEHLVSRSSPNSPESLPQQADIWRAIQNVFESLRVNAMQIWNLQRVLTKMVDAGSGKKYIDFITQKDEPSLFSTFWEVTCAILRELFTSTLDYRAAVKNVLIAAVPRMRQEAHRVLQELHASTSTSTKASTLSSKAGGGSSSSLSKITRKDDDIMAIGSSTEEQNQLLECMSSLLDNFLDRCLRRLSSPINMMFPQSSGFHASPPSRNDMLTLIRSMETELDLANSQDRVLIHGILMQLVSGVELFCNHVNRIMHTGKQAVQTSPTFARTTYQAHNMSLLSVLHQLDEAASEIFQRARRNSSANASSSSKVFIEDAALAAKIDHSFVEMQRGCHKAIRQLQYSILGPYLQALASLLENILAKMHEESFASLNEPLNSSSSASTTSQCSRYMTEFSTIFTTIHEEHLKRLVNASFVTQAVEDFAARLICVFLRHAALLRPLHEQGKLRLATDMAQLELRLESVCGSSSLRNLGACYEELRAFRHMMFLENSALLRDPMVDAIRPSNVWHHLLARGPLELQLPHQMKKISAAKYVEWLETMACGTDSSSSNGAFPLSEVPLGYPCLKRPQLALTTEQTAWKEVLKCLDSYAQRASVQGGNRASSSSASTLTKEHEVYQLLLDSGSTLLAGYEVNLTKKDKV